jgi:hypothetical protein
MGVNLRRGLADDVQLLGDIVKVDLLVRTHIRWLAWVAVVMPVASRLVSLTLPWAECLMQHSRNLNCASVSMAGMFAVGLDDGVWWQSVSVESVPGKSVDRVGLGWSENGRGPRRIDRL